MKRFAISCTIGLVIVLGVWKFKYLWVYPPDLCGQFDAIMNQAVSEVDGVEVYPSQLTPEMEKQMTRLYPRWTYHIGEDGIACLTVGDYARDDFFLMWSARDKKWIVDM